ncbi:MBL fold metallo-hydrolase [Taklimakanibacter deserti]|uniref:MBL fold metallo-hydrolase n=1 Tax=Taklimakanibacter deserti TaxID=2267839 RepID=UPI000E64F7D4
MHNTRRKFLGLAASAALFAGSSPLAIARAPLAGAVTPSYRLKIGELEVTALADGYIDLDQAIFASADKSEMSKLLEGAFLKSDAPLRTSINAFVVNTGKQLILIDCGTVQAFGPTLAKLPERLEAQGFMPEQFEAVLLTHMHPDHVGAATNKEGVARFTKAELVVSETEWKFWSDESIAAKAPKEAQPFFKFATDAGKAYGKAMRLFGKDGEIVPGITSVGLPGHTPGHTGFIVASGNESLLIWGDIVHSPALQFTHPEWSITFDVDQAQAAATRKTIFDRAAADKLLVAGMHLDFPGFGHVARGASAYDFIPAPWRLDQ